MGRRYRDDDDRYEEMVERRADRKTQPRDPKAEAEIDAEMARDYYRDEAAE